LLVPFSEQLILATPSVKLLEQVQKANADDENIPITSKLKETLTSLNIYGSPFSLKFNDSKLR
jgi:hypothetical protein